MLKEKTETRERALVVGCGRLGRLIAQRMEKAGFLVTVVDKNPEAFKKLDDFRGRFLAGDGTLKTVLVEAGIKETKAFAAVTQNDKVNLMSLQIARGIFHVPKALCRVFEHQLAEIYGEMGLDVIDVNKLGASIFENYMRSLEAIYVRALGDGSGSVIEVTADAHLEGKKVEFLEEPGQFRIFAVTRGVNVVIPGPDTLIRSGDRITGAVKTESLSLIASKFIPVENEPEGEK